MNRAKEVVIIGQGYVGLPLAQGAVAGGYRVTGLDLDQYRVDQLNSGRSVVDDVSDEEVETMLRKGYRASTDGSVCKTADIVVICVPTPLSEDRTPNLDAVRSAASSVSKHISEDTLVILESTTYPGTTALELRPALETSGMVVGEQIFLAYSPERIDPGNASYGIWNTPKVVGADDELSLEKARSFYASFVETVVTVSGTAEAELTKLLENTYRHVNIALVNELAIFCRGLGVDIWGVIDAAATKPFGFQAFYPGPGVGGHCIPIDPNYLSYSVKKTLGRPFRFIDLAEEINSAMPNYVVNRVQDILNEQQKSVNGSVILLLGVTYKSGISDVRESPAREVMEQLIGRGAKVEYHDPFVEEWTLADGNHVSRVADLEVSVREADLTVLLQNHRQFDLEKLTDLSNSFLDTRGAATVGTVHRL